MKAPTAMLVSLCLSALLASPTVAVQSWTFTQTGGKPRVVTKIVNLLEAMMTQSKADADAERILWAKYKCYCDTNQAAKEKEIEQLKEEIAMLEGKIEEVQADTALLTQEAENLVEEFEENEEDQDEADKLHDDEEIAFDAKEADLKAGIESMKNALKLLSDVGADQTVSSSAQHKQFLKGNTKPKVAFVQTLREALLAGSAMVTHQQKSTIISFIESQGPITNAYAAQSGEIVGILKNMMDTFKADLAETQRKWAESLVAHPVFIDTLKDENNTNSDTFNIKQGKLGINDAMLATLRGQLQNAKKSLQEAEDFLSSLLPKCDAKRKQYEKRVDLRVGEEAAIAQAISILSSDAAFAALPLQEAFIQKQAVIQRHTAYSFVQMEQDVSSRAALQHQLRKASRSSVALAKITALLQLGTPFDTVLAEIKKMLGLIVEEGQADEAQKTWCNTERSETDKKVLAKKGLMNNLNSDIGLLNLEVEEPTTGLLAQIKGSEDALAEAVNDQRSETTSRTAENAEYQKEIAELKQAEELVGAALRVLRKYYDDLAAKAEGTSLLQDPSEPALPDTWKDDYDGQTTDNNKAIGMLQFLLDNTAKEEKAAHTGEMAAQHAFEDEMARLKKLEADTQEILSDLRGSLAGKQMSLMDKNKDLKVTTNEKTAAEGYIASIKPGCDFLLKNLATRVFNRKQEKEALDKAVILIKDTPAYKNAVLNKHITDLGECADACLDEEDVKCKACQADTSVPGYCAGHPATKGC